MLRRYGRCVGRDRRSEDRDVFVHVVTRGNNGGAIVRDQLDCELWRNELSRVATKYRWDVWAWCLMPNHLHLVLRAVHGGLSDGMQELNGNHARRMNRRHGRTGHLVQNRFFSVELESDSHLIAAGAYVMRNPLKAALCRRAEIVDGGHLPVSDTVAGVTALGPAVMATG
jgi:REP element-mobilizing transposase RayT